MRPPPVRVFHIFLAGACVCSVQCRSAVGRTNTGPPELSHDGLPLGSLTAQVVFDGPTLAIPTDIAVVGQYVIVADLSADSVFHVLDPERVEPAVHFGRRGSGPGEFQQAWTLDPVSASRTDVWAYDAGLARMTLVNLVDNARRLRPTSGRIINLQVPAILTGPAWVDSTTLVSLGFYSSGRIGFIGSDGAFTRTAGSLPEVPSSAPPEIAQHAYQATLAPHPNRHLFAAATRHASNIEIYRNDGTALGVFEGPLPVEPRFEVQSSRGRPTMATGADLRFGYVDATASADHIYALFSGRTRAGFPGSANFGRFVHVFDWGGNFLVALELDAAVLTIAVDNDGEYLYATRHEPEPAVLQFSLASAIAVNPGTEDW